MYSNKKRKKINCEKNIRKWYSKAQTKRKETRMEPEPLNRLGHQEHKNKKTQKYERITDLQYLHHGTQTTYQARCTNNSLLQKPR